MLLACAILFAYLDIRFQAVAQPVLPASSSGSIARAWAYEAPAFLGGARAAQRTMLSGFAQIMAEVCFVITSSAISSSLWKTLAHCVTVLLSDYCVRHEA